MNIYNSVILTGLLILAFYFWIIPTSNIGKKFLNKMQAKTKKDLVKWRERQKRQNAVERNERLLH